MKKIIVLIISAITLLSACDKRKDYFEKYNQTPDLKIRKSGLGGNFNKSLADSVWIYANIYKVEYKISDQPNDEHSFKDTVLEGSGNVAYNTTTKQITFTSMALGKNVFEITATDKYNLSSSCRVELYVIPNRSPIAKLTVIQTNANSPREIKISTNLSNDVDIPYGDFIAEYQYKVGTLYTVNTPYNSINYIAATTGTVMVYLKVKDSNGAISNKDSVKININ